MVNQFEEVLNAQYLREVQEELDTKRAIKNRVMAKMTSKIQPQHKRELLKLDFDPGDALHIEVYLKQLEFREALKMKHDRKKKIHDFIGYLTEKTAEQFEAEIDFQFSESMLEGSFRKIMSD